MLQIRIFCAIEFRYLLTDNRTGLPILKKLPVIEIERFQKLHLDFLFVRTVAPVYALKAVLGRILQIDYQHW